MRSIGTSSSRESALGADLAVAAGLSSRYPTANGCVEMSSSRLPQTVALQTDKPVTELSQRGPMYHARAPTLRLENGVRFCGVPSYGDRIAAASTMIQGLPPTR